MGTYQECDLLETPQWWSLYYAQMEYSRLMGTEVETGREGKELMLQCLLDAVAGSCMRCVDLPAQRAPSSAPCWSPGCSACPAWAARKI